MKLGRLLLFIWLKICIMNNNQDPKEKAAVDEFIEKNKKGNWWQFRSLKNLFKFK